MKRRPDLEGTKQLFHSAGLALTHQRLVIFKELSRMHEHPTPESLYDRVKKKLPSLSLATVYNSVKTFAEHGLVREVSVHHGMLRFDGNTKPHHHLVCVECKRIEDIEEEDFEPVKLKKPLPRGFAVHRVSVEVLGLCRNCRQKK
jgi:Fur family transcriptional regulator, peroxide stress response regulator